MSFRQLSSEEEKLEEQVWACWEAFLYTMQDASEFVSVQTPVITQTLEDTYQVSWLLNLSNCTCSSSMVSTRSLLWNKLYVMHCISEEE